MLDCSTLTQRQRYIHPDNILRQWDAMENMCQPILIVISMVGTNVCVCSCGWCFFVCLFNSFSESARFICNASFFPIDSTLTAIFFWFFSFVRSSIVFVWRKQYLDFVLGYFRLYFRADCIWTVNEMFENWIFAGQKCLWPLRMKWASTKYIKPFLFMLSVCVIRSYVLLIQWMWISVCCQIFMVYFGNQPCEIFSQIELSTRHDNICLCLNIVSIQLNTRSKFGIA